MNHCWHPSGEVKTSFPPIDVMVCCFCGDKGHRHYTYDVQDGHGPHHRVLLPEQQVRIRPGAKDLCPGVCQSLGFPEKE